jgi:tRNA modification GTPase
VLVGAPSTGKSTLFNALLGQERAVISPFPGTTRDVLAEPLILAGAAGDFEVMLVDIAGLDTPLGSLDRDVQAAARRAIDAADLVLAIDDGDAPPPRLPMDNPALRVRTKSDTGGTAGMHDVTVSVLRGEGLAELKAAIAQHFSHAATTLAGDMLALNPRHESALRDTSSFIASARALLAPQRDHRAISHVELVAGDLRRALDALACLGGQMSPDDVIGRVFAAFCVGK